MTFFRKDLLQKRSSKGIHMKSCLFFAMVLACLLPMIVLLLMVQNNLATRSRKDRETEIQMSCYQMGQRLTSVMQYENMTVDMVSSELEHMSTLFDGRAFVINKQYRVVYDTYHLDEQRYLLESQVIEAGIKKKTIISSKQDTILISEPILSDAGELLGVFLFSASLDEVISDIRKSNEINLTIFLLIMAVMIVVCYEISKILSKPVIDLERSAQEFHNGHRSNIQGVGYSELVSTSTTLNEMIERLNEIDKSRKEFVSNVSHELKTPITSIRILADSLMQSPAEATPVELYREFMVDISQELDRETKIINDLLSMVRLDEQAVKMNYVDSDINVLVENLLKRLQPIAQTKEVELVLESFRQVNAQVDETKLSLALSNLIENSIKYNKKDGWVHVSLNADHRFFYIKVEDSGIGIPEDDINRIFDRFYRVDKARSRETGGTGLGLSITKSVILLHGGIIRVFSKENEGTTFSVRIPLNASLAKPEIKQDEKELQEMNQQEGDL